MFSLFRNRNKPPEGKVTVHVTSAGAMYVDVEELFRLPKVRRMLEEGIRHQQEESSVRRKTAEKQANKSS